MEDPTFKNSYLLRLTVILICLTLIVFISSKLQMIIVPLIFSLIFSVMLYPMARKFEAWKFPRAVSAFASIIIATVFLGGLLYFLGNQTSSLLKQAPQLAEKVDDLTEEIQFFIWDHFGITETTQTEKIENQLTKIEENGARIVTTLIGAIAKFFTDVVLIPLFVFFLLYYRKFFMDFFYRAFHSVENKMIDNIIKQMHVVIQSWLVGVVLVMLIVGVLNTIGLLILGIPYAAFFGFLAAFLLIFPFIGIILGSLLPVLMALVTKDSYWYAVCSRCCCYLLVHSNSGSKYHYTKYCRI
jgi:predicted PurR-regulated permease PerM